MWMTVLGVGLGGSLGALARFGFYRLVSGPAPHHTAGLFHPVWATCFINLMGCLLIGLFLGWAHQRPDLDDRLRAFLTMGLLAGFTTFSTFAGDILRLMNEGKAGVAVGYLALSIIGGIALCVAGYAAARVLTPAPG